ncbi:MAG: rod shape-determining protein [Eubacteriales bacterium]|nr:rod shape-determining protein [Eubacteriales bacterium]
MIFSRDLGIDLGTANTVICDKKGRVIIREPSVVAVDVKSKRVLATGDEAKAMIGRTPGSIVAVRPLQDGVIADFDMTSDMLRSFIYRSSRRNLFTKTRVVVSVPSGVTEVERRAVEDAVRSAGAQEVELIEESMAAALGSGLPVFEATGSMIVDIGGGTCDVAVISLGGIAACRSIKVGGNAFDDAIVNHMKKSHNLLIGGNTAEDIKLKIGSASSYDGEGAMDVRGRNLVDGLPKSVEITSQEIREVLAEPVGQIIAAIKETLEVTLPELAADIIDRGIYLAGGASQLRGLADLISKETKIAVHIPEKPLDCVAIGTSIKLRRAQ